MYIVNATELIPKLARHWKTVSFAAIGASVGGLMGLSRRSAELIKRDLTDEHGFSLTWPGQVAAAMSPGEDLDAMNRAAVEVLAADMAAVLAEGTPIRVGLWKWSRGFMVKATAEAVWGPQNPYRDPAAVEAWK